MTKAFTTEPDEVDLADLCWMVAPSFPEASDAAISAALATSARDFAAQTYALRAHASFITQPGLNVYEFKPVGPVLSVTELWVGDILADATSSLAVMQSQARAQRYTPFYHVEAPNRIYLENVRPFCACEVAYAHMLAFNYCRLPKYIVDQWAETLAKGAKFQLASQVGAPWFNPTAASIFREEWTFALRSAKDLGATDRMSAPIHAKAARFVL